MITSKILIKIAVAIAIIIILLFIFFLMMWKVTHTDTKDVVISGEVTNINGEPAINSTFYIINHLYQGGDSESFGTIKKHEVTTDLNGFYKIELEKSAYIQIVNKDGHTLLVDEYISKKQNKINVILKKLKVNDQK